jgi:phage terminase large subunit-like protein
VEAEALIPPPIQVSPVAIIDQQVAEIVREREERDREALRLWEPSEVQDAAHASRAKEKIIYGSNQSGKTTLGTVEAGRAFTGQDPYDKYPKRNGRALLVGKDQKHLGEVFYDKLFREGAFQIIRDADTGKWRAYRPWNPVDVARKSEAQPAPPIIPPRFIQDIAWEDKRRGVPAKVVLTTGWEIIFSTENSAPPQGIALDYVWWDEEVDNELFYPECAARLLRKAGTFVWTATPQTGTAELFDLHERAMAEAGQENPRIAEFQLDVRRNRFIPKEQVDELIEKYKNKPDDYKVRILGEFNHSSYLIYPEFSMDRRAHGCEVFEIPEDWNRWMIVDPGFAVCAVLFMAVPPPHHERGEQRFIYDELYLTNCTAEKFAANVEVKVQGRFFSGFIIDPSSLNQEKIGSGKSLFTQFSDAMTARGIQSRQSGNSFIPANNEQRSGILKVQSWLYHRPDTGRPVLQVFEDRCPNFEREVTRYRRKRNKLDGHVEDKPVDKNDHTCDCLRYIAQHDPRWEKQPAYKKRYAIYDYFKKVQRERDKASGDSRSINFGTRVA